MKKLLCLALYAFGNLAKNTDVFNPRPEVEMKEVASSSYNPTYLGFSFPDGNTLAWEVIEPPSCEGGIFVPRSASGEQLYNDSIAGGQSIQSGLCSGATELVTGSFNNIVWQKILIKEDQYSLVLSAKYVPVNSEYLQCVKEILSPPIDTYKTDMGKCSASREIDSSIFQGICVIGVLVLVGVGHYCHKLAAAGRRSEERCPRLSRLSSLLSGRHQRRGSGVDADVLIPLTNRQGSSSSTQDRPLSPGV